MVDTLPAEMEDGSFVLREWRSDEADTLTALVLANRGHLERWLPWARAEPPAGADRRVLLDGWRAERLAGGGAVYGMFVDGEPVGSCGLHDRLGPGALEIGYWVGGPFVRRGYATRATRLLTDAAFALPDVERVEIHHDGENVASSGVPRALGYRLDAIRNGGSATIGGWSTEWTWLVERRNWPGL